MDLKLIIKNKGLSERKIAALGKMNRETVHKLIKGDDTISLNSIKKFGTLIGQDVLIFLSDKEKKLNSDYSIPVISQLVAQDGKWKIHFFNFVDYFRNNPDERLILLPPVNSLGEKEDAMLRAIVCTLCVEKGIHIPAWAKEMKMLKKPWFVSGFENLKATCLIESPIYFRRNNVWVLANFLDRA